MTSGGELNHTRAFGEGTPVLVQAALPYWGALRNSSLAQAPLKGVNAACAGLVIAAVFFLFKHISTSLTLQATPATAVVVSSAQLLPTHFPLKQLAYNMAADVLLVTVSRRPYSLHFV